MERRRDERISVSLKAALLDDKTMPRGCRVRDVSQRGMLLQYEYDGKASTFKDGDTVNIRLSLRQDDERRILTLPGVVRRVEQNGIGVELLRPEAELVDILAAHRLDEKQALGASSRQHRRRAVIADSGAAVANLGTASPRGRHSAGRHTEPQSGNRRQSLAAQGRVRATPAVTERSSQRQAPFKPADRTLLYIGLASLVLAVGILVIDLGGISDVRARLSLLEQNATLTGMPASAADGTGEQQLSELNTRVDALAVSLAALETQLLSREAQPQTIMGGVAETPKTAADAARTTAEQRSAEPVAETSPTMHQAPPAATGASPGSGEQGPWRINLVSLYDQAAADRFAAKARSQGINVEQNKGTVKGRQVWRLQLTGFRTESDARSYGNTAKEKLGLNDVWIFKQ